MDADDDTPDTWGTIAGGWQLDIASVNVAPRTNPDSYQVRAGQSLTVPARGVLQNDRDPDEDTFIAVLQSEPAKGLMTLQDDGSFTYRTTKKKVKRTDSLGEWQHEEASTLRRVRPAPLSPPSQRCHTNCS